MSRCCWLFPRFLRWKMGGDDGVHVADRGRPFGPLFGLPQLRAFISFAPGEYSAFLNVGTGRNGARTGGPYRNIHFFFITRRVTYLFDFVFSPTLLICTSWWS